MADSWTPIAGSLLVMTTLSDEHVKAALAAVESPGASDLEKIDMLVEVAMALQHKPLSPQDILHAIALYDRALALCPPEEALRAARIQARKGTACNAVPDEGTAQVEAARRLFVSALTVLREAGSPEEVAEAEMNLGLTLHTLAADGKARMSEAIAAYHRALRTFTRERHPVEYAILHNNLATAYLALPAAEEGRAAQEALAVQSFQEALTVVTLAEQPIEYAMLQNNLGNALQSTAGSHGVENHLRALTAYDEALKVRTRRDRPLEYANTISNRANALRNVPDDPAHPGRGNPANVRQARLHLEEAKAIFEQFGDAAKVRAIQAVLEELER